ncbi:MAG: hypothetical protein V9G04_16150 [Nocardioides sp.]
MTSAAVDARVPASLRGLLERTKGPVALVALECPDLVGEVTTNPEGARAVVLAVPDIATLRSQARTPGLLPELARVRNLSLWIASADAPVVPEVLPGWPPLRAFDTHRTRDGGAITTLGFAGPVDASEVVRTLARTAGTTTLDHAGLVVATEVDDDAKVPPDLVLSDNAASQPNEVTGRAAVRAPMPPPVDEGVFNPIGFRRDWTRDVVDLPPGPVTPHTIRALRDAWVVRIPASLRQAEADAAALAMAGVPVCVGEPPARWRDPLIREEDSLATRREALRSRSTLAWRVDAAGEGMRTTGLPTVSIVLTTRRPEMLPFALAQIAKQAPAEVVVAGHGFAPDAQVVRHALGDRPATVLCLDGDTLFGDALQQATLAASGDVVVKFDDDDWYGPDVITDLLWARRYSDATLVGMPAEFVYLEPLGITVRRPGPTEVFGSVVAGGTMMIGRADLLSLGGWRSVARFADAQLLGAVRRAGGTIYRTQGLGYLLRRTSDGHTWNPDLAYFLNSTRVAAQWRGFAPLGWLSEDAR